MTERPDNCCHGGTITVQANYVVDGKQLFHPCWCGGTAFVDNAFGKYNSCTVIRCVACGQLRTFPEPSAESLEVIYSPATEKYSEDGFDEGRDTLFSGFGADVVRNLTPFVPEHPHLLDVGCNMGHLLFAARSAGWKADGLEINQGLIPKLRSNGFRVYDTFLETADIAPGTYDVLVANQVLEHVPDPLAFLEAAKRVVKPGGIIFLSLPCYWSPYPVILKRDSWYSLLPEEHIWQFSQPNLMTLLQRADLKVLDYKRGCSDFAGKLSPNPKSWIRYAIYKWPKWFGLGDFHNVVLRNGD
jgi:SAM-dependent methyltransferase